MILARAYGHITSYSDEGFSVGLSVDPLESAVRVDGPVDGVHDGMHRHRQTIRRLIPNTILQVAVGVRTAHGTYYVAQHQM